MSVQGRYESVGLESGEDLSGKQYFAVEVDGTVAGSANAAIGLLQNKPENAEDAAVGYHGHMKGRSGAALTKGNRVTVNSDGYLVAVSSGDGTQVGKVLKDASSGALVEGLFDFVSAHTQHDQQ